MDLAGEKGVKIHLPVDFVAGDKFAADAETKVCTVEEGVPDGWMGLDVGPKTSEAFAKVRFFSTFSALDYCRLAKNKLYCISYAF